MQKKTTNTFGFGKFKYSKNELDSMKNRVKKYGFHHQTSMFGKYQHVYKHDTALDDYDTFLDYFNEYVLFENVSTENILQFINKHSKELRDMFYIETNKEFDTDEIVYPHTVVYSLDKDFHLINTMSFYRSFEDVVIHITFLFADMVCELWKKYNNEEITYQFSQHNLTLKPFDKKDTFTKEHFPWNIDTRQ